MKGPRAIANDRFLRVLQGVPVDRTPVWLMRQAGRYLPEYREIRAREKDFLAMCKNPTVASAITLQPVERFELDAAILFSDILVVPEAMGLSLTFQAGEGPQFTHPVQSTAAVDALRMPEPMKDLAYVMAAIQETQHALAGRIPLIGFCGSPWTVATYMVEGRGSKDFRQIKKMMYGAPATLTQLLQKLAAASSAYLCAQVAAGVDALMIFDTWGGVLSDNAYRNFSLPYMAQMVAAVQQQAPHIPVILFTKHGSRWLEAMVATGCQGLGIDETMSLKEARARVGNQVALQGNIDPGTLYGTVPAIEAAVAVALADYGHGHRHIFNLGHGVLQETPPAHVQALISAVHQQSPAYHT